MFTSKMSILLFTLLCQFWWMKIGLIHSLIKLHIHISVEVSHGPGPGYDRPCLVHPLVGGGPADWLVGAWGGQNTVL